MLASPALPLLLLLLAVEEGWLTQETMECRLGAWAAEEWLSRIAASITSEVAESRRSEASMMHMLLMYGVLLSGMAVMKEGPWYGLKEVALRFSAEDHDEHDCASPSLAAASLLDAMEIVRFEVPAALLLATPVLSLVGDSFAAATVTSLLLILLTLFVLALVLTMAVPAEAAAASWSWRSSDCSRLAW